MTQTHALAAVFALTLAAVASGAAAQKDAEQKDSRAELIARAQVWQRSPIGSKDLYRGPTGPGAFAPGDVVTCEYRDEELGGASPKFACVTADGDELKVKYGGTNGEVYGEVLTSRLLWALGFGADRMYSVRVICQKCPPDVGGTLRPNGDRILDPANVERKLDGREVGEGWAWSDLDLVDPKKGGAPLAHRDALKLLAVLVQHTDNKPDNQRLLCVGAGEDGPCRRPLMMMQDVGLTFGVANTLNRQPGASVHLAEWSKLPVWREEAGCVGNLGGSVSGTLEHPDISEEGRRFLSGLLMQLSDQQLEDMFEAARVDLRPRDPASGRSGFPDTTEWVRAFKAKRAQIADRRCPNPA
jgi:hypothetical protein